MAYSIDKARKLVLKAGLELTGAGLVARTWGNISARVSDGQYVITPSGRAYDTLTKEDIVLVNIADGTYEGDVKPSGEKGVHAAVYALCPETNFVIHTHQNYASALSVLGRDIVVPTECGAGGAECGTNEAEHGTDGIECGPDEAGHGAGGTEHGADEAVHGTKGAECGTDEAGGAVRGEGQSGNIPGSVIPCADYGMYATEQLVNNIKAQIQAHEGSRAVLMKYHGALCFGKDYDEAFAAAYQLEEVCRKEYEKLCRDGYGNNEEVFGNDESGRAPDPDSKLETAKKTIEAEVLAQLKNILKQRDGVKSVMLVQTPFIVKMSSLGRTMYPYLDDVAQIAGVDIKCVSADMAQESGSFSAKEAQESGSSSAKEAQESGSSSAKVAQERGSASAKATQERENASAKVAQRTENASADLAEKTAADIGNGVDIFEIMDALQDRNAVLIKGIGAICTGFDESEAEVAGIVLEKACMAAYLAECVGNVPPLDKESAGLDRDGYVNHYSKLKHS